MLSAKNKLIYEEIRYNEDPGVNAQAATTSVDSGVEASSDSEVYNSGSEAEEVSSASSTMPSPSQGQVPRN